MSIKTKNMELEKNKSRRADLLVGGEDGWTLLEAPGEEEGSFRLDRRRVMFKGGQNILLKSQIFFIKYG